ncbi:MAG: hypothetical protein GX321_05945 [Clostridiales bacterium]|nr:hypothetical protein [Clostridiales bacterium]
MKKKVGASFTIEAVFIMPIVIFVIVSIIYITIYLHDYNRIYSVADRILHKAILNVKHESDIETGKLYYDEIKRQGVFYQILGISDIKEKDIEEYLTKKLTEGLFATNITEVEVKGSRFKITITVKGKLKIPIKGLSHISALNRGLFIQVRGQVHNPADYIRISEVILDTGSKIKGIKELEEKIKALIP